MLWPRAAKKSRDWHRGIVDAADLHDEMAQGRGGEELATLRSRGRQQQQTTTGGTGDEGVLILHL